MLLIGVQGLRCAGTEIVRPGVALKSAQRGLIILREAGRRWWRSLS